MEASGELGIGPSSVNEAVKLPSCDITVTTPRSCVPTDAAGRNRRPLVDTHTVIAPSLPPTRTRFVASCSNTTEPTTVTLCAPVTAAFVLITSDGAGPLYVTTSVTVRDAASVVTATRRECRPPEAVLLVSPVDDRHVVASVLLSPMRNTRLDTDRTTFLPSTVTLIAPVAATFVNAIELSSMSSNVTTDETVSACNPTVATARRDADAPTDTRPCTALADTHTVDSNALPPTRPNTLNLISPIPD